ncbi:hypothetical protein IW256_003945 [Actinomadura viridis]|uniref:Uncharacterized protein n=1 Tax=Actinomadura viridis TaxID=58110 RepID=A0A931DKN7_9ACTN|nr:hypothetical protein [Actinomadura viridis]
MRTETGATPWKSYRRTQQLATVITSYRVTARWCRSPTSDKSRPSTAGTLSFLTLMQSAFKGRPDTPFFGRTYHVQRAH